MKHYIENPGGRNNFDHTGSHFEIDLPPPSSNLAKDGYQMTLLAAQGISRLATEQIEYRKQVEDAKERVERIFNERKEGILEGELIAALTNENVPYSIAVAAADWLTSAGIAKKNFRTGIVSRTGKN
ncbi:hypothetical protein [Arthrobacter sp. RAF14]|uniref:hypothetical protein n=1 Tax=Arthrobacter sp. RAF14 TaxID=3233051 RepID=UPI003F8DA405